MRTYLITGGTDGMGKGLGLHFLARGDRVIAVARSAAKGRVFLDEAARLGAADRATFLSADLSVRAGMQEAIAEAAAATDSLDGVVFAAQHFQPARRETADGLESTFALSYLSRAVLGDGLFGQLENAAAPVVMNIAGPGGLPGTIAWDDLQLAGGGYSGFRAAMQSSRCNDLLGADFPARRPGARTRYVLYNPGFVRTAMSDPLPAPQRIATKALARVFAQPVAKAIVPVARLMDDPPDEPITAFLRGKPLALAGKKEFDPAAAARLRQVTAELVGR